MYSKPQAGAARFEEFNSYKVLQGSSALPKAMEEAVPSSRSGGGWSRPVFFGCLYKTQEALKQFLDFGGRI